MTQAHLSKWLKIIILLVGLCGLIIYLAVFPMYGKSLAAGYPEMEARFWPWLIFLWTTAIPCYAVLAYCWSIASHIGKDRSFSHENAKSLWRISTLAAADSIWFFVGNCLLFLLNMSHPAVLLISLLVIAFGIAVAVAAAALAHLVQKAAALQEQSDLTV